MDFAGVLKRTKRKKFIPHKFFPNFLHNYVDYKLKFFLLKKMEVAYKSFTRFSSLTENLQTGVLDSISFDADTTIFDLSVRIPKALKPKKLVNYFKGELFETHVVIETHGISSYTPFSS